MTQPTDPNVQAVQEKLAARAATGLAKYGTDTTRSDLDLLAWLRHLQEELMDAAVYAEVQIRRLEAAGRQQERDWAAYWAES